MAFLIWARVAILAMTSFKSTASMPYPNHTMGSILGNMLLGSKCTIIVMDLESKAIKVTGRPKRCTVYIANKVIIILELLIW